MGNVRSRESRRALLEQAAEIARSPGPGSFTERLRSRVLARKGPAAGRHFREALVELIEDLLAADDTLATIRPSIATLLRSSLAADAVTAAFAGEAATEEDLSVRTRLDRCEPLLRRLSGLP